MRTVNLKNATKYSSLLKDSVDYTLIDKPKVSDIPSEEKASTGQLDQSCEGQANLLNNTKISKNKTYNSKITQLSIYFSKDMKEELTHIVAIETQKQGKLLRFSDIIKSFINLGCDSLDKVDIPSYFSDLSSKEKGHSFSSQICLKIPTTDIIKYKDVLVQKTLKGECALYFATFLRYLYVLGLNTYKTTK
jgi:hypothetical protein